jgi:hypothetical protein
LLGQVLNNRPFTDTVLPVARELKPAKSSKFISDSGTTLTVVIGGVAPVGGGVCHKAWSTVDVIGPSPSLTG